MNKKKATAKASLNKTSRPYSTKDVDSRTSTKQHLNALMVFLLECGDDGVKHVDSAEPVSLKGGIV